MGGIFFAFSLFIGRREGGLLPVTGGIGSQFVQPPHTQTLGGGGVLGQATCTVRVPIISGALGRCRGDLVGHVAHLVKGLRGAE